MTCCCPHAKSGGKLFSLFARAYRRRFDRHGFEPSQQQLMAGLKQAGFKNADILEVGSGVGYLHQVLLKRGARHATGIDFSEEMLKQASDAARTNGLQDRVQYYQGDFIEMLDRIEPAEVTVLDKVVCCYPYAELLVTSSIAKTRRVYALTYPRYRWFSRIGVEVMAVFLKLFGSDFRPYVHNPDEIETWIRQAGFEKTFERTTFIWLTQIYEKSDSGA